jgi:hypothetical protein
MLLLISDNQVGMLAATANIQLSRCIGAKVSFRSVYNVTKKHYFVNALQVYF